ncbi:MAG: cysteine desulfurase family protein [Fimbriimonadaceae bacterium]
MDPSRYFDNAATTYIHPEVREAMLAAPTGNPHSNHAWGHQAQHAVERARAKITELLYLEDPSQIIFTSGATESCNSIIHLVNPDNTQVSPFEHSAIRVPAQFKNIPIVTEASQKNQILIACSNETGIIYSTQSPWYCDATQAFGKIPFDLNQTEAAAFSAHKFHGPMGVGVLFLKDPNQLQESNAHQVGGGQEQGRRGGTLNVPGIIGLAKALEIAIKNLDKNYNHAKQLREVLKNELSGYRFNESENQSPYILSVTIPRIAAQNLVTEVDRQEFAISSGAACSSQSTEPSSVLKALGLTDAEAIGTIRISFSQQNTLDSCAKLANAIKNAIKTVLK